MQVPNFLRGECGSGDAYLRGPAWTEEEIAALRRGVAQHGRSWSRITQLVPGRSANALRFEWMRLQQAVQQVGAAVEPGLGEMRHARIALTCGFLLPVHSARVIKHHAGG